MKKNINDKKQKTTPVLVDMKKKKIVKDMKGPPTCRQHKYEIETKIEEKQTSSLDKKREIVP